MKTFNYKVDILDQGIDIRERRYARTVIVSLLDNSGRTLKTRKYGWLDKKDVYSLIEKGEQVVLDHAYIKDFSLHDYRHVKELGEMDEVILKDFSAVGAFFDCHPEISFEYAHFTGQAVHFMQSHFSDGDVSFYKAHFDDGDVDFSNSRFGAGSINFQYAQFGTGDISFEHAVFENGDLSFVNAEFGDGQVSFNEASFGEGVTDFRYARFGRGDVIFNKAVFGGGQIDFSRAEFGKGKLDFRKTNFGDGDISFEECENESGRVNFRSAAFGNGDVSFRMMNFGSGKVHFDQASFGKGNLSFLEVHANYLSFKACQINHYLDMRVSEVKKLDLSSTVLRDILDMQPLPKGTEIGALYMNGMRNLGTILADWNQNKLHDLIKNQSDTSFREKAEQFRILKESFRSNGQYEDEDRAYVQFKRFELRADLEDAAAKGKSHLLSMYPQAAFKTLVFDRIGLYATNPIRVLFSIVIVYSLFSLSYAFLPLLTDAGVSCGSDTPGHILNLGKAFYFSAITFFTVGYGDCLPTGIFKFLAPVEGFMGVFLMSYFTVAFVRKILR